MSASALAASALGLSRNEAGRRFSHVEEGEALEELRQEIVELLWRTVPGSAPGGSTTSTSCPTSRPTSSWNRGLMTPSFAEGAGEGRGFAVYGEGQASLEINGVDHLRLLGFRSGDQLSDLWSLLAVLDDRLETVLTYAFDPRWGYLTGRPSQAGSGMRAYATLHAPALMLTGRLGAIAVELVTAGLALTPLWGGAGGVVQVSNLGTPG